MLSALQHHGGSLRSEQLTTWLVEVELTTWLVEVGLTTWLVEVDQELLRLGAYRVVSLSLRAWIWGPASPIVRSCH